MEFEMEHNTVKIILLFSEMNIAMEKDIGHPT